MELGIKFRFFDCKCCVFFVILWFWWKIALRERYKVCEERDGIFIMELGLLNVIFYYVEIKLVLYMILYSFSVE